MQKKIIAWLKKKVKHSGAKGLICGLSGGIDSAVAAVLMKKAFPKNSLFIYMPCKSSPLDREHALLLKRKFNLNLLEVDIEPAYNALLKSFGASAASSASRLALANLKPRLRMITLYFFANKFNYLVVGTGNKAEITVGYFTKYGDGGVDIMPIGNLVKRQVRSLAKELGVPKKIIDKPPTAGLWPGQTDEGEMGMTYDELDEVIAAMARGGKCGSVNPKVVEKVRKMHLSSAHKRALPETCEI